MCIINSCKLKYIYRYINSKIKYKKCLLPMLGYTPTMLQCWKRGNLFLVMKLGNLLFCFYWLILVLKLSRFKWFENNQLHILYFADGPDVILLGNQTPGIKPVLLYWKMASYICKVTLLSPKKVTSLYFVTFPHWAASLLSIYKNCLRLAFNGRAGSGGQA